jgi:hypothetical protein
VLVSAAALSVSPSVDLCGIVFDFFNSGLFDASLRILLDCGFDVLLPMSSRISSLSSSSSSLCLFDELFEVVALLNRIN